MTIGLLERFTLAGLLALGLASGANAQNWPPRSFEAFEAACRAQAGIKAYVENAPMSEPPAINQLCGCLVEGLADISQPDIDMLTKDLLDTATDEERMAYETYEDLRQFAG